MKVSVRIDDDLLSALQRRARERKMSLTTTVNAVLRHGLTVPQGKISETAGSDSASTSDTISADVTKTLALASDLEDDETPARKP